MKLSMFDYSTSLLPETMAVRHWFLATLDPSVAVPVCKILGKGLLCVSLDVAQAGGGTGVRPTMA